MGIGAIFTKLTLALLVEVLAPLRFIVVIRNVHHLHLHVYGKLLYNSKKVRYLSLVCAAIALRKMQKVPISPNIRNSTYFLSFSQFVLSMSKVALTPDMTVIGLLKVLAQLCLI